MGAMKSQFRKSGGRLSDVDGVITEYEFTDIFPFGDGQPKTWKSGEGRSLYAVLSVRQDGADEDIIEPLWAGDATQFQISADGHVLTPLEGSYQLGERSDFAAFIQSLETAGQPGAQSDRTDGISFEPMIGSRVHFVQVGQLDKNGRPLKRVAKTGKYAGKEFNQTTTQVSKYYGVVVQPKGTKAAKATTPAAIKTKGNGKLAPAEDVSELAISTLLDLLSEAEDNRIPKAKLRMKLFAKLGTKHPQRDAVIKYLYDDANLVGIEGVTYERSDPAQAISLA